MMQIRILRCRALAIGIAAAGMTFAGAAGAVDVENRDEKAHSVTLTEPGGKRTIEVKPGETKMDLCAVCTASIDGAEPARGSGLDKIVIKDGMLTVEAF